jgi:hypothetical protein
MEPVRYPDPGVGLKLVDGNHVDCFPRHSITDAGADLTADALVPPDADGGNHRPGILTRRFVIDTVYGAERDTGLTAGAGIIDDGHEARSLFLCRFFVLMGDFVVQGGLSSPVEVGFYTIMRWSLSM